MDVLTIGQLGRATDTKVETIRYYERIGLLPVPDRTSGNYRSYTPAHLQRLGFIRRARDLGFSIEDVRDLLKLAAHAEEPCEQVDQLVTRHLEATERRIAALTRLRRELRETLDACDGGPIAECKIMQALSPTLQVGPKRTRGAARRPSRVASG